jgi:hypothetical protein
MKTNIRTTIAGVLSLILTLGPALWPRHSVLFSQIAAVCVSLGLIAAADAGRRQEDSRAR